ncbi:LuxR C-terminal-related transcriptional regulator [Actinoallomurus sp. NPDC052308]|uniref:ATP-binding protein n=1 Tax=Actinoallomurus sp. NPDC052308 TaxID=3155530 RepID=UPI00342D074E
MNATPEARGAGPGSLPEDLTSFVGRRRLTDTARRFLADSRLVTLTGVGGVGKTRLAVHVARQVHRAFRDGVRFVELADVDDPSLVPTAVAAELRLPEASVRELTAVLVDYLADKQLLIVLDNCEHLLQCCAGLVGDLLRTASGVRVLATSREPMMISGERVLEVEPLPVPSAPVVVSDATMDEYPALRLFQDRASAIVPGFSVNPGNASVVTSVCRRLDGLPLAIELAAAWLRVLSLEQLSARLEDRFRLLKTGEQGAPARHRTLRAAVRWSFDLCSTSERLLWSRLSVFTGEFDLDAAEAVCAGDGLDVFTAMSGLLDKSIIVRCGGGPRASYRMLETIRQYGAERLADTGEAPRLRCTHRDYFLREAERADACSCGPRQGEWVRRLTAERGNLWAALEFCLDEPAQARAGLRMADALWFYWVGCGFVREGAHWLGRALALDPEPSHERVRALWIDGWIAFLRGENATSLVLLRQALELAGELDDEADRIYALQFYAEAEMFVGNLDVAVPMLEQALAGHRASGAWTAPALLIFGQCARPAVLAGDIDLAVALLTECLSICDSLGERWTRSWSEWNLGVAYWTTGALRKAAAHLRSSLRAKQDLVDRLGIPFCVELLGWVAISAGRTDRAAVLFGAADAGWDLIGRPLFGFDTLLRWRRQNRAWCRESLGDAGFAAACRRGALMPQPELVGFALEAEPPEEPAAVVVAPSAAADQALTKRERQVAEMVARGMTNKEIAEHLLIAQRTAESHIENILSKLGFTSRTQIAVWAAHRRRA